MGPLRLTAAAACTVLAAACSQTPLEALPLQISVEASRTTVAPGDTIVFVATMQGGDLLGLDVQFGDSATAQVSAGGARTARIAVRHAYTTPGSYAALLTVTDGLAGQKAATTQILVK